MKLSHVCGVAALALAAFGLAGAAAADCQLKTIAEFHLTMDGNRALVDASINGRPVRLLVDTGSYATIISRPAAADLGLTLTRINGLDTYDVNGVDETDVAYVHEFTLGGETAHNVPLVVTAKGLDSDKFQGLLGESILAQADMELDFADGVVRLFRPQGCVGDQVVYWGKAYSTAPIAPSNDPDDLHIYATVNGQRVVAALDTGAYRTVVTSQTAARADVSISGPPDAWVGVFPTIAIGEETIRNARLQVADLFAKDTATPINTHLARKIDNLPDMLLGADFIGAHRIYVARSQGKVYFSYTGGAVFQAPAPAKP
jgi:predicted aspartyl protease